MRHVPWWFCLGLFVIPVDTGNAQPLIEGVVAPIDHRADASTFRIRRSGVAWASQPIYHQDAKFLRLHFTDIRDDRATGYTVRIVSGDQTLLTLTPEEMGRTTDFWTPKLMSSRVQVMVEVETTTADIERADRVPTGLSFRISELAYPRMDAQILSVFGQQPNYLHLRDHADDHRLMRSAQAVARLDFIADGQSKTCTGFLVSSNRVMTNDHCISSQDVCQTASVIFDYRLGADGAEEQGPTYRCKKLLPSPGGALAKLDGAVIEVYGDPGVNGREPLLLAALPVDPSHGLVMIHHPGGEPMRISKKRCRVRTVQAPGVDDRPVDFGHRCDSNPGSSGAPILDEETLRVVGLHHWGFQTWGPFMRENRAVRIEHIRPLMP